MITVIKKGTPSVEIKNRVEKAVQKIKKNNILKYAGKLKTDINPLQFQKEMRNEWK